jgi:ABC-2 type transport system permease protein
MMSEQRNNKKTGARNIFVIAQKEFADIITSPLFLMLAATYTLIVFTFSYRSVLLGQYTGVESILMNSFSNITKQVGWFAPLIGIALGFDAVVRERKSGSLNVLLTHPVFRDNIITGKLLGITSILALVILFSMMVPLGTILIISGVQVGEMELMRIAVFAVVTFFYVLIFAGIAILLSIIASVLYPVRSLLQLLPSSQANPIHLNWLPNWQTSRRFITTAKRLLAGSI